MRSAEDAQYYRRMEVVVNRVMMRLMECVLKERPESSKHVLVTISDVIKQNLKASDKIWLCGACAAMNETEAVVCHSCRLGKNEPIPPQEAGDGPLLVALRHDLARREESLALREHLIAVRERDLGVDTSPMPVAKVKAKSATDVPSRFGDGADLLPSQEKVPEKPVLFPKGYVPLPQASSADGKAEHEHWYLLEAFISYGMERPWVVDTERRCVLVDNNQRSPLHELAGSLMSPGFETKVFRKLAVAPLIDMQDDQGDTALHEAARHRPITAQLLIDCGASLTIVNNARRTPLHECCESNFSVELCKAMLCGGADLDARDADDKTAYDLCIDSMDVDANDDAASAVAAKDFAFLAPSSAASD